MDNNKIIIYTLIILLIAAVIFNPVITGDALSSLWTSPDVGVAPTIKTATSTAVQKCLTLTNTQKKSCVFSKCLKLSNDQCLKSCGDVVIQGRIVFNGPIGDCMSICLSFGGTVTDCYKSCYQS